MLNSYKVSMAGGEDLVHSPSFEYASTDRYSKKKAETKYSFNGES